MNTGTDCLDGIPPWVQEELETLYHNSIIPPGRRAISRFAIAPEDRADFERTTTAEFIDSLASASERHSYQTLIEVGMKSDLIQENRGKVLLSELGFASPKRPVTRPSWNPTRGNLTLGGREIGRIQVRHLKTNLQLVLDKLELAGWPDEIESPRLEPDQLNQAAHGLNKRISGIRFHVGGGGKRIYWHHTS